MLRTIGKVRNSQGLILDAALSELTGLRTGDVVNVTAHEGGAVVIMPIRANLTTVNAAATAKVLIRRNSTLFKRLA